LWGQVLPFPEGEMGTMTFEKMSSGVKREASPVHVPAGADSGGEPTEIATMSGIRR
jgi:hypothetical protein